MSLMRLEQAKIEKRLGKTLLQLPLGCCYPACLLTCQAHKERIEINLQENTVYVEDIARQCEDVNFIFEWSKQYVSE